MGRKAMKAMAAGGKSRGHDKQSDKVQVVADGPSDHGKTNHAKLRVIAFYSDRQGKRYREFSNFFSEAPAFEFVLPLFCRREGWPESWPCEFSEKAIMLTKAALMGDREAFDEIGSASSPAACKKLGRGVRNFKQELWEHHLEQTAFEVVYQKFAASRSLREVLLSTGDAVLAEAAPNDQIWGIGMGASDERSKNPAQWLGRNVLGFALMRARASLRKETLNADEARAIAGLITPSMPKSEEGTSGALVNATMPAEEAVDTCDGPHAAETMHATTCAQEVVDSTWEPQEDFLRPITDLQAVRSCYERYGVVGVTGVLSAEECRTLICEGLEPELPEGCHMHEPDTYDIADANMNRYGVVGKSALFSEALLNARLHPNVVESYKAVHGREDVFACHDRFAWMRPTQMRKEWDTPFSWPGLHFDVSLKSYFGPADPTRAGIDELLAESDYTSLDGFVRENNAKHESMGRTVQGVLNLFDNDEEDGGFHCVPGFFGTNLKDWVATHPRLPAAEPNGRYNLGGCGPDSRLGAQAIRVPCPAGTLILFDATLPHGTRPNTSHRNRAILFLRYLTSDELPVAAWRNRNAALRRISKEVNFNADARQERHLYGPE